MAAPNVSNAFGVEPDALSQAQTLYAGSKQYGLGGSLIIKDGMTDSYNFIGTATTNSVRSAFVRCALTNPPSDTPTFPGKVY